MSENQKPKKKLMAGIGMVIVFAVVLVMIFMPIYSGHNGLDYLDNLYNSISKGSAYYIPGLREDAKKFEGKKVTLDLNFDSEAVAKRALALFAASGAQASIKGNSLKVSGDLGRILQSSLQDAEVMFQNDGQAMAKRYNNAKPKEMLYTWWLSFNAMAKSLNRQKAFAQTKFVDTVRAKALEVAYNFYKVAPQSIGSKWGIVAFSLLFYVLYTLWYGFGVMYLFEGTGFQLDH